MCSVGYRCLSATPLALKVCSWEMALRATVKSPMLANAIMVSMAWAVIWRQEAEADEVEADEEEEEGGEE